MSVFSILVSAFVACALLATPAFARTHHAATHHGIKTVDNKYPALKLGAINSFTDMPSGAPYNIKDVYVLGLSSGGFLAVQMNVAFSSEYSGAGIFAAGPFYCAQGSLTTALEVCVNALEPIDLSSLEATTVLLDGAGAIDGLKNLTGAPIYLFHGTSDRTVFAPVNEALYQMYVDFGANVVYNNGTDANHAWISPLGPNQCTESSSPYISNCDIDPENDLLAHMFQTSIAPSVTPAGNIYSFSQDQYAQSLFSTNAATFSMDTTGYIYMPKQCASGTECQLLTVLHGCEQGYYSIQGTLINDANLNGYADSNNFIVLYPQAIASELQSNPEGCWDWWGYTGGSSTAYVSHGAPQMEIIRAVQKALGFKGKSAQRQAAAAQLIAQA